MDAINNILFKSISSAKYIRMLMYLIVVASFIVTGCADNNYTFIRTLHYPNAYNINYYRSILNSTSTLTYVVNLKYPSLSVLEYYDKRLGELGWVPFSEKGYENNYRRWSSYVDGKKKGNPLVHELIALWTNSDRSRMIMLGLRYYSYGVDKGKDSTITPNSTAQEITLQVMRFTVLS